MKTKFMINGSTVSVYKLNEETALDKLPAKIYTVRLDPLAGYYLEMTKDYLEVPSKIYGNTMSRVDKCLSTYKERAATTGILLTGHKGTGKSLLMALLANKAIDELEIPILIINDSFNGAQFNSFIESIGECCMVFDEFGKVYASGSTRSSSFEPEEATPKQGHQNSLLSLIDGVDKTKRMIIMSENSEIDISDFLLNRPSRIYYHFRYKKLDQDSILGYCKDCGVSEEIVNEVLELSKRLKSFSFDMLKSIVEEHLRFDSSVEDCIKDLNIDTKESADVTVEVIKVIEKGINKERQMLNSPFIKKPERNSYLKLKTAEEDEDEDDKVYAYVGSSDIVYEHNGKTIYETSNYTVVTKDLPITEFDFSLLV